MYSTVCEQIFLRLGSVRIQIKFHGSGSELVIRIRIRPLVLTENFHKKF